MVPKSKKEKAVEANLALVERLIKRGNDSLAEALLIQTLHNAGAFADEDSATVGLVLLELVDLYEQQDRLVEVVSGG